MACRDIISLVQHDILWPAGGGSVWLIAKPEQSELCDDTYFFPD